LAFPGKEKQAMSRFTMLLAILFIWLLLALPAAAQSPFLPGATAAKPSEPAPVTLPDDLGAAEVGTFVAGLTDGQARELLLAQIEQRVAASEAEETAADGEGGLTALLMATHQRSAAF